MSDGIGGRVIALGEVCDESRTRASDGARDRPVYGVDRSKGLTPEAKYVSGDLSRYKLLETGMFAYNPMRLNIGSIGYCSERMEPGLVSPDYVVFRTRADQLLPQYLQYYTETPPWKVWTGGAGSGSVRLRVYYHELARMPLVLPPLAEQKAVTAALGAMDERLRQLLDMVETLSRLASSVFQVAFPDLPAGDGNAQAVASAGWSVKPIADFTRVVAGSTPPTDEPDYWGGEIGFATPRDLANLPAPVLMKTQRQITPAGLRSIGSRLLPPGAVLLSSRAPIGYLALTRLPVAVNQGVIAMVCDRGVSNHFVLQWVAASMSSIERLGSGTTFAEVSKTAFRSLMMPVPPPERLARFTRTAEAVHERTVSALTEHENLLRLRQLVLRELVCVRPGRAVADRDTGES